MASVHSNREWSWNSKILTKFLYFTGCCWKIFWANRSCDFRPTPILFALGTVFLFFSGADLVGYYITGVMMGPVLHFEWWWAPFGVLASTITSIFWTPQHSLPGFLAAFLVIRYPYRTLENVGIIGTDVSVWSPFAAIGLVPIVLWAAYKTSFKKLISYSNIIAAPVLLIMAAIFLFEGLSNIPSAFSECHYTTLN